MVVAPVVITIPALVPVSLVVTVAIAVPITVLAAIIPIVIAATLIALAVAVVVITAVAARLLLSHRPAANCHPHSRCGQKPFPSYHVSSDPSRAFLIVGSDWSTPNSKDGSRSSKLA